MLKHVLIVTITLTCAMAGAGYVEERAAAQALRRSRKTEEALAAFRELARMEGISEFQTSDALQQAAAAARVLQQHELAEQLADRIPIEPVAKTVQMQNLASQRKYEDLIAQFGDADIDSWPEWNAVDAHQARGQAYYELGNGRAAEEDLSKATRLMAHDMSEEAAYLWTLLANNRAKHLKDDAGALSAFRRIVDVFGKRGGGGAAHLRGILQAAAFLREQGYVQEALDAVQLMKPFERSGYWGGAARCALGATLAELGRAEDAIAAYEAVVADETAHSSQHAAAEAAIAELEGREKQKE